jgi:hypothetical protein
MVRFAASFGAELQRTGHRDGSVHCCRSLARAGFLETGEAL